MFIVEGNGVSIEGGAVSTVSVKWACVSREWSGSSGVFGTFSSG